jgi:hypothetical protein
MRPHRVFGGTQEELKPEGQSRAHSLSEVLIRERLVSSMGWHSRRCTTASRIQAKECQMKYFESLESVDTQARQSTYNGRDRNSSRPACFHRCMIGRGDIQFVRADDINWRRDIKLKDCGCKFFWDPTLLSTVTSSDLCTVLVVWCLIDRVNHTLRAVCR